MRQVPFSNDAVLESARRLFLGSTLITASLLLAGCDGTDAEQNGAGGASESVQNPAKPDLPFVGTFSGSLAGTPVKLTLDQQGETLSGRLSAGLQISTLTGTVSGNSATGQLQNPDGTSGNVKFERVGETLNMALTLTNAASGQSQTFDVSFKSVGGSSNASTQPGNADSAATRDELLVGRWIHTEAGGSGGFSYAIDTHMAFNEDGSYRHGDSKMGAGDASFSSVNEGKEAEVGQWRTEDKIVYVRLDANSDWVPLAKYYAEANRMMLTYNNGNKQVWTRE